jgi:OmpA-OmpF porin, OOP family
MVLSLVGCVVAPMEPAQSPAPKAPATSSAPNSTPEVAAAAALVRANAAIPQPIASVPITAGNLAGGQFVVYSVTVAGSSTVLQFGVDHPDLASGSPDLEEEWEPTLVAGAKTYRPTGWFDGEWVKSKSDGLSLQSSVWHVFSPARASVAVSYPALTGEVTQVRVDSPLFGSVKVPVTRSPQPPQGSDQVPIVGRLVYQDLQHEEITAPLIVTIHAVRRVPNGTAIYYSVAFPEGVSGVAMSTWGGTNQMLTSLINSRFFGSALGLVDRASMKGYAQVRSELARSVELKLSSRTGALEEGLKAGSVMAGIALTPELPATTSRVDVMVGGQQFVLDVPVTDGALGQPDAATQVVLGAGWPSYSTQALAELTPEQKEAATSTLFDRVKEDSVTTGNHRLNVESDVLFAFNKSTLTSSADRVIAKAVALIKASGSTGKIQVIGYTDDVGDAGYNQGLSNKRASAVAARLRASLGTAYTFQAVGRGEANPVASNKNDAGRALNRRVEIVLP